MIIPMRQLQSVPASGTANGETKQVCTATAERQFIVEGYEQELFMGSRATMALKPDDGQDFQDCRARTGTVNACLAYVNHAAT